ncbi:MAG: universal stress protein [Aggregatilineales bacterium]
MAESGRYQRIVVPLDGSPWSEGAIPHAVTIARNNEAEIILLHILKPPVSEYADQLALAGQDEQLDRIREMMKQKLVSIRNELRGQNIKCIVQMIEGAGIAHLICDYINDNDIDMVVMSTHGRSGLARFVFGSVAHKVMQDVHVPVMLIRPGDEA